MSASAPYREADPPAPLPPRTVEMALGDVLSALHGLSDDERENVLLAVASLYQLDIVHDDGTAYVSLDALSRIVESMKGGG